MNRLMIYTALALGMGACVDIDTESSAGEWAHDSDPGVFSGIDGLYCNTEPEDACELYVCALVDCYNQANESLPIGYTIETACPNYDATDADEEALYTCYAYGWAEADCTEGTHAASPAVTACNQ